MKSYDLPESAVIGGVEYAIRSDYRAALDVMGVMSDPDLSNEERTFLVLTIFYEDFDSMPLRDFQEAIDYCVWFIGGGEEPDGGKRPKIMDWQKDFPLIVAPVNKVLGFEVRSVEHLHWWTFLAAYQEIGDCLFAQVVSIRRKKMRGEKLDKADKRFYRENRKIIDLKPHFSASEAEALMKAWAAAAADNENKEGE